MKPFLAVLLLMLAPLSWAHTVFYPGNYPLTVPDLSCDTVKAAYQAFMDANGIGWQYGRYLDYCSADPVRIGTSITFLEGADGPLSIPDIILDCPSGTHYDRPAFACLADASNASDSAAVADLNAALASLQNTVAAQSASITQAQAGMQTLLNAQAEPFDVRTAWAAFVFFFSSVILLWSVAKGAGIVLAAIRDRWRF